MLTASQCYKKYGAPTDEKFMVSWDVPKELEIGVIPKRIYCNKDMIEPLTKAFKNLIATGFVALYRDEFCEEDFCVHYFEV